MKEKGSDEGVVGNRVPRELFLGADVPANFYARKRYLANQIVEATADLTERKHRRRSPKLLLLLIDILRRGGYGESYHLGKGLGTLRRRV
jgi:hypothetical protein